MDAIILAGGAGTRLKYVISDIPKPMAPVRGQPFLKYLFDWLIKNGIEKVILSVCYKWEIIFNQFNNKYKELDLTYSIEEIPLGTGGAIRQALKSSDTNETLIINGDTFFDIDINELLNFHIINHMKLSIALKPMENFTRYGKVEINDKNEIIKFHEKKPSSNGLINGGIYILNKSVIEKFPEKEQFSFEKEFLEDRLGTLKFGGYLTDKYFIDIGIPEDYRRAQLEMSII